MPQGACGWLGVASLVFGSGGVGGVLCQRVGLHRAPYLVFGSGGVGVLLWQCTGLHRALATWWWLFVDGEAGLECSGNPFGL